MLKLVISSLYLVLPAYVANMAPVIWNKISQKTANPINEKLFGSHKTWRGFFGGYIGAFIMLIIQMALAKNHIFNDYAILDYEKINLFLFAFLFGIGTPTGDLVKSFFKRKLGIKAGAPFPPFDQLDFIIGTLIFLALGQVLFGAGLILPWGNLIVILIATPILHFATNVIGYLLKLKKVWW